MVEQTWGGWCGDYLTQVGSSQTQAARRSRWQGYTEKFGELRALASACALPFPLCFWVALCLWACFLVSDTYLLCVRTRTFCVRVLLCPFFLPLNQSNTRDKHWYIGIQPGNQMGIKSGRWLPPHAGSLEPAAWRRRAMSPGRRSVQPDHRRTPKAAVPWGGSFCFPLMAPRMTPELDVAAILLASQQVCAKKTLILRRGP